MKISQLIVYKSNGQLNIELYEGLGYIEHDSGIESHLILHEGSFYDDNLGMQDGIKKYETMIDATFHALDKDELGKTFPISSNPITALETLSNLEMELHAKKYVDVHVLPLLNLDDLSKEPISLEKANSLPVTSLEPKGFMSSSDIIKAVAQSILRLEKTAPKHYNKTMTVIKKLIEMHDKNPEQKFSTLLHSPTAFDLAMGNPKPYFASPDATLRIKYLERLIAFYLRNDDSYELDKILNSYQLMLKKELLQPAIDLPAPDGKRYNWYYTEYTLLKEANFQVRPDGKMSFSVTNLPKYLSVYAPGKKLHDKMADEFNSLAKVLGLGFDSSSDFHSEIVFDAASSKKLIADGLHITPHYLKTLIREKSIANSLLRISGTFFNKVPKDIKNLLCDVLSSDIEYKKPGGHSLGCALHQMTKLPTDLTPYRGSYLFCKDGAVNKVYYVPSSGVIGEVPIKDFAQFKKQLADFNKKDKDIVYLDKGQIQILITDNGGHTPSLEFSLHPEDKKIARNLGFEKPNMK